MEKDLTAKIRRLMQQIKEQALLEETKKRKSRSYTLHPDQKKSTLRS